jgi:hypothetical protein
MNNDKNNVIRDITKMITLSLPEHTSQELEEALSRHSETNELGICTVYKYQYGYLVYCYENMERLHDHKNLILPELYNLMEYAQKNDCEFLMLDENGPTVSDLPTYDR